MTIKTLSMIRATVCMYVCMYVLYTTPNLERTGEEWGLKWILKISSLYPRDVLDSLVREVAFRKK